MAAWTHVWPAGEVEQFVLIGNSGLLLQLPHQDTDEVGVFDDNRHLLEHVLEADARLLQAAGWQIRQKERRKGQKCFCSDVRKRHVIEVYNDCAISHKAFHHYLFTLNAFTNLSTTTIQPWVTSLLFLFCWHAATHLHYNQREHNPSFSVWHIKQFWGDSLPVLYRIFNLHAWHDTQEQGISFGNEPETKQNSCPEKSGSRLMRSHYGHIWKRTGSGGGVKHFVHAFNCSPHGSTFDTLLHFTSFWSTCNGLSCMEHCSVAIWLVFLSKLPPSRIKAKWIIMWCMSHFDYLKMVWYDRTSILPCRSNVRRSRSKWLFYGLCW